MREEALMMHTKIVPLRRMYRQSALILYTPRDRLAPLRQPEELPEVQQEVAERKCNPSYADPRLTALPLRDIYVQDALRTMVNAHVFALDAGLLDQVWFYGGGVSEYTKLIANHALHRSTIVCFAPGDSPQRKLLYEMTSTGALAEVRG